MNKQALFRQFVTFITAVHQVTHEMTKGAKPDDITPLQYSMLEYIKVSPPVTLSDISDCLDMSMPNTSREIKKLCDKGLCEKAADAVDRRKQFIRLTPDGERMMNLAFQRIENRFLERIKDASPEELDELGHALQVLQAKIFYR